MDTAATVKPPPAIRWIVALTLVVACAILATFLVGGSRAQTDTVHTVCLLTIALAAYVWVLYPTGGSLVVTSVVLVCLVWAWAARQAPALGADIAACGILVSAAAWRRRRRDRRLQRMQQILDDLDEERTVNEQAIALAGQTREALQKKLSRYTQLQTIAEGLSDLTDLGSIAQLAVDRAFALIGKSDVCLLFLVDQEQQELSLFASKKRESIASIRAKHGDQFDRYILRTHRPLLVNDVRRDFRFTVTVSPERDVSSVIACPLLLGQSAEGVLRLDSSHPGAYTQDDLRFLDILLDLVSTAVTNAKLFAQTQRLAVTDSLTGLTLRRPFLEQLTRELTRAGRSREPVSVLMLDVDDFKAYNDTFGHMAGDLILKGVAEVLRAVVPPGGIIARYGGEEFVVLLPRLSRHQASDVAEKIRRLVEQQVHGSERSPARPSTPLREGGEHQAVTVSLGVASFPDDAQAELELIRIADHRLYQAKRAGRNLVCSS
jgi:diguanylate cyclase (GGDEF)-like protein